MNSPAPAISSLRFLEHKIPPPLLVIVTGVAMWAVRGVAPGFDLTLGWRAGVGGFLAALGLSFLVAGFLAFRKAKTTIDPLRIESASSVVTGGIFAYTSNPMYVGFTALLVAWSCYLAIPWTLLGPVFFVLFINRFQILPEEKVMSAKFGEVYDEYRRQVRRWL